MQFYFKTVKNSQESNKVLAKKLQNKKLSEFHEKNKLVYLTFYLRKMIGRKKFLHYPERNS